MSSASRTDDDVACFDLAGGLAAQINDTLAIVLLNVEYLDDVIDELAAAAARPRTQADGVIHDVMAAVGRIRDVARDLELLSGAGQGDLAEIFAAVLRLVRPSLGETEVIDDVHGPAPTAMARRDLAQVSALVLGEIRRSLRTCHSTLTATCVHRDHEIALAVRAAVEAGSHALDGEATWRAVRALIEPHGGRLAIEHADAGFAIELRLRATS